jgi:hypothetical protein
VKEERNDVEEGEEFFGIYIASERMWNTLTIWKQEEKKKHQNY